jgi:dTMP kinase
MPGIIISIDGIDLAGKQTQALLLTNKLRDAGYSVALRTYPEYDSRYGKIVRDFLDKKITLNVNELFLMFLADMIKDREKIEADVAKGSVVIMDRYFLDTIAYQSAGGLSYETLKTVEDAMGLPKPRIVIYLDIPGTVSLERKRKQGEKPDRFEENIAYLETVRQAFERLFKENYAGAEWIKIDGKSSIEEVHKQILDKVTTIIKAAKVPQVSNLNL